MPGELVLVPHALECAVERVLADAALEVPVAGNEVNLRWLEFLQQMPNDFLRLQ